MAIDIPEEVAARLSDYDRGFLDGLAEYAVWRNGVQEVGSMGTTLRQASSRFLRDRGIEIPEVRP